MLVGKIGSWIRTKTWIQQCFIPTIVWKSLMFVTGPLDCCQRTIRLLYFMSDGLFCGISGFFDINSYNTRYEHCLAVVAIEQLNHLGCWTLCLVSKTCIWKHNLFHIILIEAYRLKISNILLNDVRQKWWKIFKIQLIIECP